MKSKIKKNQILMKGIATIVLFMLIVTFSSTLQVVFATEGDPSAGDGWDAGENGGEVSNDTNTDYSESEITIEAMKDYLNVLDNSFSYERFIAKIASENTIEIKKEVELRALSIYVANGENCSGKTFKIMNNIGATSQEWIPIGNATTQFSGTMDGMGHTITGITITNKQSYAGLFGYVSYGTVKNLNIADSNIDISPEVQNPYINDLRQENRVNYYHLGGIAGAAKGENIINCKNSGKISGGNYVGGIVGYAIDTQVEHCSNSGEIKAYVCAGGIVGVMIGRRKSFRY